MYNFIEKSFNHLLVLAFLAVTLMVTVPGALGVTTPVLALIVANLELLIFQE